MRSAVVYLYDAELRPGTIGVDFQSSNNTNEEYTLRYEQDEAAKLLEDVLEWINEGAKK